MQGGLVARAQRNRHFGDHDSVGATRALCLLPHIIHVIVLKSTKNITYRLTGAPRGHTP